MKNLTILQFHKFVLNTVRASYDYDQGSEHEMVQAYYLAIFMGRIEL